MSILRPGKWTKCISILLLTAACVRGGEPTPTSTPPPVIPPTAPPVVETPTPTPAPFLPAPTAETGSNTLVDLRPFPLDLVTIDVGNIDRLVRFRQLTATGLPAATSGATLAFLASYEYSLTAHFDDGQTIVWNIASGEVSYQDQYPSDGSRFFENPALAISPAFQGYLATSTSNAGSGEAGSARSIVVRPPHESDEAFMLPADGPHQDDSERVMSLAFSPDGHLLVIGIGGLQGGVVQIWDIWQSDDRRLIREIDYDDNVSTVRFSPDGSTLVCTVGEALIRLDPNDGRELGREAFDFPLDGYSAGPNGESFAVWGSHVAVLDSPASQPPIEIPALREFRRVAFSPDERWAVLVDDGLLRFWDLSAGVELTSFSSHYPLLDVAVLDNGRVLATIDEDGQVSLWGVRAGSELPQSRAMISATNAPLLERAASLYVPGSYQAHFSPGSDWFASGSSEGIYLVDLASLQLKRLIPMAGGGYPGFDISKNGWWLAWDENDGVVRIWDVWRDALGSEINVPEKACCWQVLFTPDNHNLVTVGDLTARVWHTLSWQEDYAREGVQQVHASPDGTRLAFEQGLDVNILDLKTFEDVKQLTGFTTASPVITTKFSPTWNVMYWAGRASMQFVDVESGVLGPEVPFSWGEFSPQGDRIAAVEDGWIMDTVGQVHMIDVHTGETLAVLDHHEDAIVRAAAFSPDGKLLATALGDTIKIWDALSGEELTTLPKAGGNVQSLVFSPDRRVLLSTSEGDLIELWVVPEEALPSSELINAGTARSVTQVDSLQLDETATDAVFSPDMRDVAASTASGAIWYWDLTDGRAIEGVRSHKDWIYHLAYDPTGGTLISVSKDGYFRQRHGPGSYGSGINERVGEQSALAFFPDGKTVATGGQDGMLRLRQLPYEGTTMAIEAHPAWLWDVAVSPTGDLLATASADRSIKLWELELDADGNYSLREVRTLTGHTATVWGVAFAPDGRTLASASWDGTVRLWDTRTGAQVASLEGHTDWVYDVAYAPDGSVLASASADGTIRLWNPATGEPLATLDGPGGRIWSVEFSPDGRRLLSASDAGEVSMWGVVP